MIKVVTHAKRAVRANSEQAKEYGELAGLAKRSQSVQVHFPAFLPCLHDTRAATEKRSLDAWGLAQRRTPKPSEVIARTVRVLWPS